MRSYLFMMKLIVPCAARLRRISLASTAMPSGYKQSMTRINVIATVCFMFVNLFK